MVHRPARLLLVLLRTGRLYAGFLGRWCGTNQQIEEAVRGRARPGSNQQRHWLVWAAAGGSAHCLPPLTLWQRRSFWDQLGCNRGKQRPGDNLALALASDKELLVSGSDHSARTQQKSLMQAGASLVTCLALMVSRQLSWHFG